MIKNLMFDLGGVIMDIDRMNCVRAFERLGMKNIQDFLGDYGQKGVFLALEAGEIGADEFRAEVRKMIPGEVTDSQIDDAFNEFLTGIPVHRLRQLRELHARWPLYLLSNTNPIMMESRIAADFRIEGLEATDYFDGIVTSYEARSCKPAREIFDYAAAKFGIVPSETLFFDDSQKNVEAARSYGYHAVRVNPGDEFADLLTQYLDKQPLK